MRKSPKEEFHLRLSASAEELKKIKKQIQFVSLFRVVVFLTTALAIFLLTTVGYLYVIFAATVGISLFLFLIKKHQKLEMQKAHLLAFAQINEEEIKRIERITEGLKTGEEYLKADHPYAADLDIFGKRSVFQHINRTALHSGQQKLVATLLTPIIDRKTLKERQESIKELQNKLEWRQMFQAKGIEPKFISGEKPEQPNDLTDLLDWASENKKTYNRTLYKFLLFVTPIVGFSIVAAIILKLIPPISFLIFLFLPFAILGPKLAEINRHHEVLSRKNTLLRVYARLFNMIEKESFTTTFSKNAQSKIANGRAQASNEINHLSAITAAFDYRLNILVGFMLNIFFLWDIRQLIRLEKWKAKNSAHLIGWFEGLSDFDELNSFAGFAYGNSDSVFPVLSEKEFEFSGDNLKHPLMTENKCVGNPVSFSGFHQFQVITGANMAGKSTYLRTVGINLVLAMTGSPVLANQFTFSPVQLFTGIKTSDSLQDGESYFFAELKRLKEMIERLKGGQPLFIILDEILRGTNSADKQKGSKALITQLISFQASGMIATHDLSLGKLADQFPENAENKRFEVEIKDNNLSFDYILKEGISQNLNATFLMDKMGITF